MEYSTTITVKSTPKDVFLHLLNIFTFYISVIAFITLHIQYINALFPDPLVFYYTALTNAVRMSTSVLLVAFPVFLLTSWLLAKDFTATPGKRELKLRKWLVYFTLFVSAVTIIVDLIMLVNDFLGGELTIRFFLKTMVVLLVAGAVFGYYIQDLRRKEINSKTPKTFAWIISSVLLVSIICGFFIVGTPAVQRNRRFDEQRISELQMLQSQIVYYWTQKKGLPQNLSELEDSISGFVVPKDPETNLAYGYNIIDSLSFELCAAFKTSNKNLLDFSRKPYYSPESFQQNWEHEAGQTCFTRTIDPELYKYNGQLKGLLPARY